MASVRVGSERQERILPLPLRGFSQIEPRGGRGVDPDVVEAIEGPSEGGGVQRFESSSFERERYQRYLRRVGARDFFEAADAEG